jgi:hypothetical protein
MMVVMPGPATDFVGSGDPAQLIGDQKKIRTRTLAKQTSQLAYLSAKLGSRLRYWLKSTERDKATGDGPMPDEDWRETYKQYTAAVLGLLREQRERQKMANAFVKAAGIERQLTPEEEQLELMSLARETVLSMPEEELQRLLKERNK